MFDICFNALILGQVRTGGADYTHKFTVLTVVKTEVYTDEQSGTSKETVVSTDAPLRGEVLCK
jgi:hypothetical protein